MNTKEYRKKAANVNKMKQYSKQVNFANKEKSYKQKKKEKKVTKNDKMKAYADNIQRPWENDFEDPYDSMLKQSAKLDDLDFVPAYDPASNPNKRDPPQFAPLEDHME